MPNPNIIAVYKNGNYSVELFDDGTKIRETYDKDATEFLPEFPENIDLKITNYCDLNCPYCHENSNTRGEHAVLTPLPQFIKTLHPFTELAIGGGNPLSHPGLLTFLEDLKSRNIISNLTVNQTHFQRDTDIIDYLVNNKLIYGIGVSFTEITPNLLKDLKKYKNLVVHTIHGITTQAQFEYLQNNDLKILILGYKDQVGRGKPYYNKYKTSIQENQTYLYNNLSELFDKFNVVSFDNLAITQLNLKRLFSKKAWDQFYMGDDGKFTMYVDLVTRTYNVSSTHPREESKPISKEMFNAINQFDSTCN